MKPIPLRVFLLGLLFTIAYALVPAAFVTWKWVTLWHDWPDWRILGPLVYSTGGLGVTAYVLKYRALLQLPPDWSQAWQLAQGARRRETTVQTVEKQMDPPAVVTTTVKETEILKPPEIIG